MILNQRWFDRKFMLRPPPMDFPAILDRLRTAPSRAADLVRPIAPEALVRRPDESWSIQEHVGHLLDLEPLWSRRLEELLRGAGWLEAADLQNRMTHEARHNERLMADLLYDFGAARQRLVTRLQELEGPQLTLESMHPRLNEPINAVGLCFFVAEHDDHHLATIRSRM